MILSSLKKKESKSIEKLDIAEKKIINKNLENPPIEDNNTTKKISIKGRRLARESATQVIYQWQVNKTYIEDILIEFHHHKRHKKKIDLEYFNILTRGVVENFETLNQIMAKYYPKSSYHVSTVDKSILAIATFEIYHLHSILDGIVSIDEAIISSKKFSPSKHYQFINGVLNNMYSDKIKSSTN